MYIIVLCTFVQMHVSHRVYLTQIHHGYLSRTMRSRDLVGLKLIMTSQALIDFDNVTGARFVEQKIVKYCGGFVIPHWLHIIFFFF